MSAQRDLFANFERMRREMDELFGDVLSQPVRRRAGFMPAVDVYYEGDPPRAIVQAEIAGVDADEIGLEIKGRQLVIAGHRRRAISEGRLYQQLEIASGAFRRVIELGADVAGDEAKAQFRDGILRVELPLIEPAEQTHSVPIETNRRSEIR
jgi:HSP20 family protein